MDKELCRTLALGSLMRGYFHNLKGTLQSLSLQLQILYMKKDLLVSPQGHPNIEKALQFLQKLQNQIEVALEDLSNNEEGPWDLKEIMEKELLFWEANLFFKHKVTKEILEEKKVFIQCPLNELRGTLCLIEEALYPALKEGDHLRIILTQEDRPKIIFETSQGFEEEALQKLKTRLPYISIGDLEVESHKVILSFNS